MDSNLQNFQVIISIVKDIVTALSALTAAIITVIGLSTWKKQLKIKTEYDLAQRLLKSVYKI